MNKLYNILDIPFNDCKYVIVDFLIGDLLKIQDTLKKKFKFNNKTEYNIENKHVILNRKINQYYSSSKNIFDSLNYYKLVKISVDFLDSDLFICCFDQKRWFLGTNLDNKLKSHYDIEFNSDDLNSIIPIFWSDREYVPLKEKYAMSLDRLLDVLNNYLEHRKYLFAIQTYFST